MNDILRAARRRLTKSALLRKLFGRPNHAATSLGDASYAARMEAETAVYKDVADINVLPAIFHYWSNAYLRPMLEEFGVSNPDQFFAKYLLESARACNDDAPVFVSIGSGNCDTEVRVALLLRDAGLTRFVIECVDMNRHMLERGRAMAQAENVAEHIRTVEADFNRWRAPQRYTGVMANQSLHHVMNLEGLFDEIKRSLLPRAFFVTSDMIGRNGHMRWPEALHEVQNFWRELPSEYRYNRQLGRHEPMYEDWDCSTEGFEGIRAQDILPLLLERFDFRAFVGFGNVIDVFIDRSFGHNFDATQAWDREFIDRVHAFDERGFADGTLKPTHMMAVMTAEPAAERECARGLTARASLRDPATGPLD